MSNNIRFVFDEESKKLIKSFLSENNLNVSKGITKIGKLYRNHRAKVFKNPSILDTNLKWKPLNPVSKAYKNKKVGSGKPILTFSGKLGRSFSQKGSEGNVTIENETIKGTKNIDVDKLYEKFKK